MNSMKKRKNKLKITETLEKIMKLDEIKNIFFFF